jgi:hypothetical protein
MIVFDSVSGYISRPLLDNDRIFPRMDPDSYRSTCFPPHHWSDQLWLGTGKSPGLTFHKAEFAHGNMHAVYILLFQAYPFRKEGCE